MKIDQMRNLGPASAAMLGTIGVYSAEDLDNLGSVEAYVRMKKFVTQGISLIMLWAMEAALLDMDWRLLPEEIKQPCVLKLPKN
ncbi:MAG: TfoX/Sxy family DNA transformation protein [Mycobacteriaceae bacterium]